MRIEPGQKRGNWDIGIFGIFSTSWSLPPLLSFFPEKFNYPQKFLKSFELWFSPPLYFFWKKFTSPQKFWRKFHLPSKFQEKISTPLMPSSIPWLPIKKVQPLSTQIDILRIYPNGNISKAKNNGTLAEPLLKSKFEPEFPFWLIIFEEISRPETKWKTYRT